MQGLSRDERDKQMELMTNPPHGEGCSMGEAKRKYQVACKSKMAAMAPGSKSGVAGRAVQSDPA